MPAGPGEAVERALIAGHPEGQGLTILQGHHDPHGFVVGRAVAEGGRQLQRAARALEPVGAMSSAPSCRLPAAMARAMVTSSAWAGVGTVGRGAGGGEERGRGQG